MTKIGAFDAKTHLPQLLARVMAGESIIITRHGEDVAHLIPPPSKAKRVDLLAAVARWKTARKSVRLGDLKVRELIETGRR
jgi:prevent-host-death family protein